MTRTTQADPAGKPKAKAPRRMARQKPAPELVPDTTAANTPAPVKQTRLALLTGLLSRPEGATIAAMQAATGWQAHSVRGFLAGTLKKKGIIVTSEPAEAGRIYRIEPAAADA